MRLETTYRPGVIPLPTEKASVEHILDIRSWCDKLLSFRTTRSRSFRFQPGQFVRLGMKSDKGGVIWRPYSMVSADYDEYLEFFSILVPDGAFSDRLSRAAVGDEMYVEKSPYGYLTTSRFVGGEDLWLLASGTGIAPFLSILRDLAVWGQYENIVLAYSVREARELAYQEEIVGLGSDELFADAKARLQYVPIVTRESVPGMLDRRLTELIRDGSLEQRVNLPLDQARARLLLCGNPQMLDDLRGILQERGLRPDRSREPGNFASENYW
ncbi:MAG: ferredoxin--NADP reductase [Betaproteobacteria bacterium]|nr:ferredoxin--NADP reductase [Betaproteobacteria bacterium]